MILLHTGDLHVGSPLSTRLSHGKVAERKRELIATFRRIAERAESLGAAGVILAGDLFDSESVGKRAIDTVLAIIERARVNFFYLPGNHEKDVLLASGLSLPENLFLFGEDWTSFDLGEVTLTGRSRTAAGMASSLVLPQEKKNIVVLHGELRDKSAEGGVIGGREFCETAADLLCLGHYHSYSEVPLSERLTAVYAGTPEPRGFDECGEKGFGLIEADARGVRERFVPFAMRSLHEISVPITGIARTIDLENAIENATRGIPSTDLLRVTLVGERDLSLRFDREATADRFSEKFYYFEIKEETKLSLCAEDFRFDKSLKGEFIRLVMEKKNLSDEEKERIIHCGLSALAGETPDDL